VPGLGRAPIGEGVSYAEQMDKEMQRRADEQKRIAEETARTWGQVAFTMEYSMTNAFEQMVFEAQTFGDAVKAILRDVTMAMARAFIFQPIAKGITSAFLPAEAMAAVFHRGGMAGQMAATRPVPMLAAMAAPRFHSGVPGLRGNEQLGILQRGERIIPAGQSGVEVHMHNESGIALSVTSVKHSVQGMKEMIRMTIRQDMAEGRNPFNGRGI
jgi:hypothetical protein